MKKTPNLVVHPWSDWPTAIKSGARKDYYYIENWMIASGFKAEIEDDLVKELYDPGKRGRKLKNPIGILRLPLVAKIENFELLYNDQASIGFLLEMVNDSLSMRTFLKIQPGDKLGRIAIDRRTPDSRDIHKALMKYNYVIKRYLDDIAWYWRDSHPYDWKKSKRYWWVQKMDAWVKPHKNYLSEATSEQPH